VRCRCTGYVAISWRAYSGSLAARSHLGHVLGQLLGLGRREITMEPSEAAGGEGEEIGPGPKDGDIGISGGRRGAASSRAEDERQPPVG
jgi:hypothetical protein